MTPLRLLMIEDSEADALLQAAELERGGFDVEFERVETLSSMDDALENQVWDIIFCDYKMPKLETSEALSLLKSKRMDIPLIVISGAIGDDLAVETMRAGAQDYLMKDNLVRLASAVKRELLEAKNRRLGRQVEQEKAETEFRLSSIVRNALDGIISIDMLGIVELFNPAAERIFGYQSTEIIGKPINLLMPMPYSDEHDEYMQNYLQTGITKVIGVVREETGLRKDGSTFPVDLAISEIWLGDQRKFTGIVRDITERKKAEKEREELIQDINSKYSALKEVLKYIEKEKDDLKQAVKINAEKLLLPLVKKLREKDAGANTEIHNTLENNIHELTSEFGVKVSNKLLNLSPKEIEVCNFIKTGCSTKETASFIGVSAQTVDTHRNSIRHKLGISGKNINLTTYLNSL